MNQQFLRFIFYLLVCLTLPLSATAQVVDIPDANLRAAIQTALGKPSGHPITANEMVTLTRLDAWGSDIRDLTGLEGATNLTWLDLMKNSISDISALAGLTNLTWLRLYDNSVSDISALRGLTNLTGLDLRDNSVSDISALRGLTQLISLQLTYNLVSDISALAGLTELTWLQLGNNSILDISALAGLTQLTTLQLGNNSISDISALVGLTELTWLELGNTSISDVSALAGLTQLTTLDLRYNSISDISALVGLTELTWLALHNNFISDISPLVANMGLGSGDKVYLRGNRLSALSFTHVSTLQSRGVTVDAPAGVWSVGEPYTVRLIYFLPNNRQSHPDIDTKADMAIKVVQQFYADMMESHGFGGKTFRFETDTTGKAVVHHVNGKFDDAYYVHSPSKVVEEIDQQFDRSRRFYLTALDASSEVRRNSQWRGIALDGVAIVFAPGFGVAVHELGHVFGLQHDNRKPGDQMVKSFCTAEWLDAHPAFNPDVSPLNHNYNTTTEMLSLNLLSPPNTLRLRFKVTDADGLHQAQLHTDEINVTGGLLACKRLNGTNSTVEFVITTLLPKYKSVYLVVMDVHGNFSWSKEFPIDITTLLPPPEVVSIPDANLAAAVQHKIDSPITTHTILNLSLLDILNSQITDLTGLEHALNLRALTLSNNSVSDISALAGLTNLTGLYLSNNSVSDISALAGLTNLTGLYLSNNSVSDISALAGLTNLTTLHLYSNSVSDISVLAGLTNLTTLDLSNNSVSDISALAGLTNLTTLHLFGNSISDISVLAGLTNLTTLSLSGDSVSDISVLAGLTKLTTLDLLDNSVSDISISALAGLTNLTDLTLSNNSVSDISALVGLTNLTTLDLRGNPLSYVSINTHIPAMQAKGIKVQFDPHPPTTLVKISGDQHGSPATPLSHPFVVEVRDEWGRPFEGVPVTFALTVGGGTLSITQTTTNTDGKAESTLTLGPNMGTYTVSVSAAGVEQPVTFTAVAGEEVTIPDSNLQAAIRTALGMAAGARIVPSKLTELTSLDASNATIGNLTGLELATNLTYLNLEGNPVSDISALVGLTNLRLLALYSNSVSDISALGGLTNLTDLNLGYNSILDISALAGLTKLRFLDLSNNSVSDISALVGLTNLTTLDLRSNSVSDISALGG